MISSNDITEKTSLKILFGRKLLKFWVKLIYPRILKEIAPDLSICICFCVFTQCFFPSTLVEPFFMNFFNLSESELLHLKLCNFIYVSSLY